MSVADNADIVWVIYYPVYYLIIKTDIFTISINETEAMQLNSKMDLNDDDDTFDPLFLSVL